MTAGKEAGYVSRGIGSQARVSSGLRASTRSTRATISSILGPADAERTAASRASRMSSSCFFTIDSPSDSGTQAGRKSS
jgi:hypothetical protein